VHVRKVLSKKQQYYVEKITKQIKNNITDKIKTVNLLAIKPRQDLTK